MTERSIIFGKNAGLIATIATPLPDALPHAETGFIFFNAGVVHRVGVHRTNVTIARALVALGIPSIRFDLAGLGDSARADGKNSFAEQTVLDIQDAMDALTAATGVRRFVLYGVCSGAVHSYSAALADERVAGVAMFDTFKYPTYKAQIRRITLRLKRYGSTAAIIKRVVSMGFRFMSNALASLRKPAAPKAERVVSSIGFFAYRPLKAEFAFGLRTLLNRGTKIFLIYAGSGFEHYNYANQFKDAFKKFGITDQIETAFLLDVDHTATRLAAQTELVACMTQWAAQFSTEREKN
jgi:pimeloyl-ACP methyl ester carboxylesterase